MAAACEADDGSKETMYTFRFGTTDKIIHLTEQQLNRIPYLSVLVMHKNDFLCVQNENGEYALNNPIEYTWFMAILRSITSSNSYTLFNELPENNTILDTLQLFDYLGIDSFPLPLLKEKDLIRSNPVDIENQANHVVYRKANLSEARQTAAEFIIALAKNEYELRDLNTKRCIFNLVNIILVNTAVFSSRFRHHTFIMVKKRCYSFFCKTQQRQLQTTHRIAQYGKINSSMYLSDDDEPLPNKFRNTFTWRGVYMPIEDNNTNFLSVNSSDASVLLPLSTINWFVLDHYREDGLYHIHLSVIRCFDDREINIDECQQDGTKDEAQSARSGRFNTLPKRPKIDRFKHRCGPKAQKYR